MSPWPSTMTEQLAREIIEGVLRSDRRNRRVQNLIRCNLRSNDARKMISRRAIRDMRKDRARHRAVMRIIGEILGGVKDEGCESIVTADRFWAVRSEKGG